jgi:glycerol-3-phosphate acyltransferase PlsY
LAVLRRRGGSGNIGATNVLRTGSKPLAAATLLLDGGKGAAAVLIGGAFGPDVAFLAGLGAFIGHLFPVWLRFRGGKGVATFLGVMLGIAWPVGLLACLTWLAMAALLRYSSLAALIAAAATPAYALWLADWQRMELAAICAVLIFVRHHANIRRLIKGEEPKIGGRSEAS